MYEASRDKLPDGRARGRSAEPARPGGGGGRDPVSSEILRLQRQAGNQAVNALLGPLRGRGLALQRDRGHPGGDKEHKHAPDDKEYLERRQEGLKKGFKAFSDLGYISALVPEKEALGNITVVPAAAFEREYGPNIKGVFSPGLLYGSSIQIKEGADFDSFLHEICHRLSKSKLPTSLDEGLTEYFRIQVATQASLAGGATPPKRQTSYARFLDLATKTIAELKETPVNSAYWAGDREPLKSAVKSKADGLFARWKRSYKNSRTRVDEKVKPLLGQPDAYKAWKALIKRDLTEFALAMIQAPDTLFKSRRFDPDQLMSAPEAVSGASVQAVTVQRHLPVTEEEEPPEGD